MKNRFFLSWILPIITMFLASLFASSHPDTLEAVAEKYGFDSFAKNITSVFTDYSFPFISNEILSSFLSGIAGIVLLYILYKLLILVSNRFAK
ncbi:MAG: PDGLE domain-containing protein [Elusimicrobiota bacterium]|jgi:hypothetical protein|nr:PDGLE domain-containing protein [Elusimicrobiota bacterium]